MLSIDELISELRYKDSISGIKTLQPWATWIFFRGKTEDIRRYPNRYRGLAAIIASGWDNYFNKKETMIELPYKYEQFCIIGFVRLIDITHYIDQKTFESNYTRHFNPPHFFDGECYGWNFKDITPIKPIYYEHAKNKGKDVIQLQGKMARVRILISEIIDRIQKVD